MKFGSGFRFDTLVNGIRRNLIDGKPEYKDVQVITSKISEDEIQMVLLDTDGVRASQLTREIAKEVQNGMLNTLFKVQNGKNIIIIFKCNILFTSVNALVRGIIRSLHEKSDRIWLNSYGCEVLWVKFCFGLFFLQTLTRAVSNIAF